MLQLTLPALETHRILHSKFESMRRNSTHMSNEKNPGWLGYIGDYTTHLNRDYNKPL